MSARQAGAQLQAGSEQLQAAVQALQEHAAGRDRRTSRYSRWRYWARCSSSCSRAHGAARSSPTRAGSATQAEAENKRNQEAILRLLNEMGDLADGDLTIRAQVTEDITGAIADSMNYTIDELRTLVAGVNNAAIQVTQKTAQAQSISAELLGAAERQSKEIEETTAQVLQVSRSISEVSSTADEGARVAQRSLAAADKGRAAVQNSISGMNDIREQIQETSKRIKRLGESSQEIGEIVELISDITEQTNVLALNAAIQAASAGEAGRGFSVVAEEVQRLAERSGEATKQIGAIVKTIQADTQDAVAAMEKSTMGVVEGAKLSDAAGQALSEIDYVTKNLAQLIQAISQATHTQANATTRGRAEHAGHPRDHAPDDARHAAGGGLHPRPRGGGPGAEELRLGLQAVARTRDARRIPDMAANPINRLRSWPPYVGQDGDRPLAQPGAREPGQARGQSRPIARPAKYILTHLHQATGALAMVGLGAATRFNEELEKLVAYLEGEDAARLPGSVAVAKKRHLGALHVPRLAAGRPARPVRCACSRRTSSSIARAARSMPTRAISSIPNLAATLPPLPRREALDDAVLAKALALQRQQYQQGLLRVIKGARRPRCDAPDARRPSPPSNRCRPRRPTARSGPPPPRSSMRSCSVAWRSRPSIKPLFAKLDQQVKQLIEGSAEGRRAPLPRPAFDGRTRAARSPSASSTLKQVYRLEQLIAVPDRGLPARPTTRTW